MNDYMWIVAKIKNKEIGLLKNSFKNLLGSIPEFYMPKISIEKIVKNKILKFDNFILGDYIFIKHKNFENIDVMSSIRYLKGLDYILPFVKSSQEEISSFILKCKDNENELGYLTQNFFNLIINEKFNFNSGPFVKFIGEILELQKNRIRVLVGNYTVSINSKKSDCILKTI